MYRDAACLASVERRDPLGGGWGTAPTMLEPRCALGVALSHDVGSLFAAGGYGGGENYLDSAECLDVTAAADAAWRPLPRMSCARAGASAAMGPDGRLYVLGGGPDGRTQHATMEALDPRGAAWDATLPPLRVGRHYNAAAFGPDGRLYVSGSFRHEGHLDVVECFDPRAGRWQDLPSIGQPVAFSAGAFVWGA